MKIYHNPRCKKSRETLQLIRDRGTEPEIVEYLKEPPSSQELSEILDKLDEEIGSIIRKNEKEYKEHFKGKEMSQEEWLQILQENPKLLQRPIVVEEERAVIGRPPEKVEELF